MTEIAFLDGAVEGMTLDVTRTPEYLRVAVGDDGVSALASHRDEPRDDEVIHVYRRLGRHRETVGYAEADDFYARGPNPDLVYNNARWRSAITEHVRERKAAEHVAR